MELLIPIVFLINNFSVSEGPKFFVELRLKIKWKQYRVDLMQILFEELTVLNLHDFFSVFSGLLRSRFAFKNQLF